MVMNRIILADDHSFIRLGLIQILKDEYPSVEIIEVSDGEALIKAVTLNDCDLVISDLDMPGRSGLEALQQIELINAIKRISLGRKYITPEIAEKLLEQNAEDKELHELLSNREFEIFKLLAFGKTITQIAESLSIALTTVSTHRGKIMEKLNLT